ncbi:anaphase-promoting complex subunit 10 [Enteropsectra breve]|nr:anaphase-promoting complex subunit 10 [Enteropsectra breve]
MMEIFLSSCKKGYGVKELMSEESREFWCTEDNLPHSIKIDFPVLTYVYSVNLFLDYNTDDSYTPRVIHVHFNGQKKTVRFNEPSGWREILIESNVYEFYLIVAENHSEGKDTRIRRMQIKSGPSEPMYYEEASSP